MPPRRALARFLLIASVLAVAAPIARADEANPQKLEEAKTLFRQGNELRKSGDCQGAVELYLRSRALVPSAANTTNAAFCLDRLERFDEALELYDELLTHFRKDLNDADMAAILPAMQALRRRVGAVDVTANVIGTVVIDGRARGRLPLGGPVRVLAGRHVLRILKDGYATYEASFDVAVGKSVRIDARLAPLAGAGQLRVEDATNPGAAVYVDGVAVGAAPWEGTLGPGAHVVWTQKDDRGSLPTRAFVVQGQTALLKLRSAVIGPHVSIRTEPTTAEVAVDGVVVGRGGFHGRLPVGRHAITASEAGYFEKSEPLEEPGAGGVPVRRTIALLIDRDHPRWPRAETGDFVIAAFGGPAFSRTLAGTAAQVCVDCGPGAIGALVGGRLGFRFPFGVVPELSAGYLRLRSSFRTTATASFDGGGQPTNVLYTLDHLQTLSGPLLGVGASARGGFGSRFGVYGRATVGFVVARVSDPITGSARTTGPTAPIGVTDRDEELSATPLVVMPELGVDVRLGRFALGASLIVGLSPLAGPAFSHDEVEVSPACSKANPGAVGCAPSAPVVAGERSFGPFMFLVPGASATLTL